MLPTPAAMTATARHLDAAARARLATALLFLGCGAGIGAWAASVAHVQRDTGLSDGQLGTALLALATGALISMPLAGRFTARYGMARLSAWSGPAFAVSVLLPGLSSLCGDWALPVLAAALFLLGGLHGATDIAMNGEASLLEQRTGRPMMSSFHAGWSIGGMLGSASVSLLLAQGWTVRAAMGLAGGVLLAVFLLAILLNRSIPADAKTDAGTGTGRGWTAPLLYLGCLAFLAFMIEGAMMDWSSVYLGTLSPEGLALGGSGFAAFSLTMAATRLAGDRIVLRLGPVRTCALSAALATLGMAAALATHAPAIAVAGFALLGLGMANVVPLLFAAAGRRGGSAGVATLATLGYGGGLAGPPLIGFLAACWGLRAALALLLAGIVLIGLNAISMGDQQRDR